jgi:hypothetical protein
MNRLSVISALIFAAATLPAASAHLTYPAARNFGTFTGVEPQTVTITGQTTKAFSWADGTDADFARQDDQRYFQFSLQSEMTVTVTITSLDAALFLPAFSIYAGLGHAITDSTNPDYDGAAVTQAYLASLGEPQPREGAFDALHTFKIGNDSKPESGYVADLVTFTYKGHAADGNSSNYGTAAGIAGDGIADGLISASFVLGAGAYTMVVGGANYASTDATARGFNATVTAVPEPSCIVLLGVGLTAIGTSRPIRRRRGTSSATAGGRV